MHALSVYSQNTLVNHIIIAGALACRTFEGCFLRNKRVYWIALIVFQKFGKIPIQEVWKAIENYARDYSSLLHYFLRLQKLKNAVFISHK